MSFKQKIIFQFFTIAVLGIMLMLSYFLSPENEARRVENISLFDENAEKNVIRMTIKQPNDIFALVKEGAGWKVQPDPQNPSMRYPADTSRITDLLHALTRIVRYPIRASTQAAYAALGLNDSEGTLLEAYTASDHALLRLYAGNETNETGENIYRKADNPKSFSGPDEIARLIKGERHTWYELRLFPDSVTFESVQRIHVEAKGLKLGGLQEPACFSYELIRSNAGAWMVVGNPNFETERAKVDGCIKSLVIAKADDFLNVAENEESLFAQIAKIEVETGNGIITRLTIGAGTGKDRFTTKISDNPFVYRTGSWLIDRLLKPLSELTVKK